MENGIVFTVSSFAGPVDGTIAEVVAQSVDNAGYAYDEPIDGCARDRVHKLAQVVGFLAKRLSPGDQQELAAILGK